MALSQHFQQLLAIFSLRMHRNGHLGTSGQKYDTTEQFGVLDLFEKLVCVIVPNFVPIGQTVEEIW